MNLICEVFIDLDVRFYNDVSVHWINDVVKRCRSDDAVTKRFDLFAVSDDRLGPDTAERAAILFGYDHVLRDVD